jgi:hypothetical protein
MRCSRVALGGMRLSACQAALVLAMGSKLYVAGLDNLHGKGYTFREVSTTAEG